MAGAAALPCCCFFFFFDALEGVSFVDSAAAGAVSAGTAASVSRSADAGSTAGFAFFFFLRLFFLA